jgi:hypothetical protein
VVHTGQNTVRVHLELFDLNDSLPFTFHMCASIPITRVTYIEDAFSKGKPIGKCNMFVSYC